MRAVPVDGGAGPPRSRWRALPSQPWWPWLKRGAMLAFIAVIAGLLISEARAVHWHEVFAAMRRTPAATLLGAAALAYCSHLLYSCFDLFGRRYTGHRLRKSEVMKVNFISYAFNLNLGTLVGGVAFRFRLYSQLGLKTGTISRIVSLSLVTNWLGYLVLAGAGLLWWPLALPPEWGAHAIALQVFGGGLLAVAIGYLMLCAFSRRRSFHVRGQHLKLPSLRMALLQFTLSAVNWCLIGGTIYVLLGQRIEFPTVLCVLLAAAIAGVITHVPAGLGVLEAVFVAMLAHRIPKEELLAALLTYRAIYYLAPLLVATLMYVLFEARGNRAARA